MEKQNKTNIELYEARAKAKILKEYFSYKEKMLSDSVDRDKNYSLLKQLKKISEEKKDNLEIIHSKEVIKKCCFENIKRIKKSQIGLIESEDKLKNKNIDKSLYSDTDIIKEFFDESVEINNNVHNDVRLLLKEYHEFKEK